MSKEIDQFLKKQLIDTPKFLKNYLKTDIEKTKEQKYYKSPVITYYTGNWGQDLEDNLTPTQRNKLQKEMLKLNTKLVFLSRKLPNNVGGYDYVAYVK